MSRQAVLGIGDWDQLRRESRAAAQFPFVPEPAARGVVAGQVHAVAS